MFEGNLQKETFNTTRFMWNDGDNSLSAGVLLSAITKLTDSQKESVTIDNKEVTDYLETKGFITSTDEQNQFKVVNDDKKQELITLGDKVSDAIGKEIESLPVNAEIKLVPTIFVTPVPIPFVPKPDTE